MILKKETSLFINNGVTELKNKISSEESLRLYKKIIKDKKFGKHIFRSFSDFKNFPNFKKTNPGPKKNNLALKYNLNFIENNSYFKKIIENILGKKYEIILKKFVVATPKKWVPKWVLKKAKSQLIPNLNNYIKDEYRDSTFFRGIDYHMDMIDHPNKKNKYITLYVYLNKVNLKYSPINVLKKSFKIGADKFPHDIKKIKKNTYVVQKKLLCYNKTLTGNPGDFFVWSSFALHGTAPGASVDPRISIRYTIKKKGITKSSIDKLYKKISGPHYFKKKVRDDINEKTFKQKKFTKILK